MNEIKLIKRIKYAEDVYKELTERAGFPTDLASNFLNNIPDADAVEVVHGRWVEQWDYDYMQYFHFCSECGKGALTKEETMHDEVLSLYCPNCGARMNGGEQNGAND